MLVVNGSYREGGATDQVIAAAQQQLHAAGAEVDEVKLREYPIEFCLNCRECTQEPGEIPGKCVIDDSMAALVEKIEAADAYILAAPTNLGSVSAVFKRFMERLVVYAYWPWGQEWPRYRKDGSPVKKAMLVSSSAAPSFPARWLYGSGRQLRMTAKVIGAKPVGLLFSGMVSRQKQSHLSPRTIARAQSMAQSLLSDQAHTRLTRET
ncbi:MAG: flavodoxin family protein [Gammaproteobacteria bacterium]|nr:flavodoxin family protein [Gammaproteobacteria bacterium]